MIWFPEHLRYMQRLGLVKCKSDHSYYSHHVPLTASQRLQAHKENALTERARWNRRARSVTSIDCKEKNALIERALRMETLG